MKKKVLLGSVMLSGAAIASQEVQADEVKVVAQSEAQVQPQTQPQTQSSSKVASQPQTPAVQEEAVNVETPQVVDASTEKAPQPEHHSATIVNEATVKEEIVQDNPVENKQEVEQTQLQETVEEPVQEEDEVEEEVVSESSTKETSQKENQETSFDEEEFVESSAEDKETEATNTVNEETEEETKEDEQYKEDKQDNNNDVIKDDMTSEDVEDETKDNEVAEDKAEDKKDKNEQTDDKVSDRTDDKTSEKTDAVSKEDKKEAEEDTEEKDDKKNEATKNDEKEETDKEENIVNKKEQSSSKEQKVTSLKENKKKQYTPAKEATTVEKETVFEKAMRDPESLTQKEIDQLTDEEMAELALEGKIYNKQMLESFATRQVYSRSGGQTAAGKAFVKKWGEAARKVANRYGVYASVMMAQAMLESGYGQSELASKHHNLFGIKAGPGYKGKKVLYWTQEFINGQWYTVQDYFRHYDDLESSFEDNAKVIRYGTDWDSSYYKGAWKENCNSYKDAAQWLQGRYATDPTYANKLISIIQTYNLTQFDTPAPSNNQTNKPSHNTTSNGTVYHTVQRGETLRKIANQYKTSVNKIASDNKIKDVNKISVGQKLKIIKTTTSKPSKPTTSTNKPSTNKPTTNKPSTNKPVASQTKTYKYTVKRGDTLGKIANQYKVTVNSIAKENKIKNVNHIYVGQTLKITKKGASSTNKPSTNKPTYETVTHNKTYTYTVKRGDTLGKIANNYDVTVNHIAKENKIKNVNRISVGQKLKITKKVTEKVQVNKVTSPAKTTYKTVKTIQKYTYTVKRGDTLSKIANKNKVTVNHIAKENKIKNVNRISVGQKLKIKKTVTKKVKVQSTKKATTKKTSVKKSTSSKSKAYTVKRGDTLYSIARRYNVSVATLVKKNGLHNANQLAIGQKIKIK